ncbi:MAG: LEVG family PEP-CTERM protein [Calothrix sp. FI2-JRJ7]|jgi:hypothetical protein|nr:LEVG family PEP-CTERM protein [Calothrix sp. FI2-JRJ7]
MQKAMLLAKIFAATTLGLSVLTFASTANAASLVPNKEGEIKTTNLGCLNANKCIDTTAAAANGLPFGYTVTSLKYDFDNKYPKFVESRLFADDRSTKNNYGFGITFNKQDAGTNPDLNQLWMRPSAMLGLTSTFEIGQLEVGRFKFDFGKNIGSVTFDLFDVEDKGTSILEVNGKTTKINAVAGADSNRQTITIHDVSSFVIQLGNHDSKLFPKTGDGVAMRVSVPEPGTVISLGALAVAGIISARQRKKVNIG